MPRSRAALSMLLVLLAVGAPAASAQKGTSAPPGLSGADEYLETVPSTGGGRTVGNGQGPKLSDPSVAKAAKSSLPAATVETLRSQGSTGSAAAALAAQGAPAATGGDAGPSSPKSSAKATSAGRSAPERGHLDPRLTKGAGPLATVTHVATGGGGMGLLFPLLIVLGAAIVGGPALWRRHRPPSA